MARQFKKRCFLCNQRIARELRVRGKAFRYCMGADTPVFCSRQCAANFAIWWALGHVNRYWHWCNYRRRWVEEPIEECKPCALAGSKGGPS